MLRYSPRFMPANTDGEAILCTQYATPLSLLAVTTTGCFATRDDKGQIRIHRWFYNAWGKEAITLEPTRFVALWSCRAPWNEERCGEITSLHCPNNELTGMDVRSLRRLRYLNCAGNALTRLDCSEMKELRAVDCRHNELTYLDVDDCPQLTRIRTFGNAQLRLSEKQLLRQARGEPTSALF